jgi:hypothetical protein
MTKANGKGRGGKRANAGRPPKHPPSGELAQQIAEIERILGLDSATPTLDELAQTAYRTLHRIMAHPLVEAAPKVSAARAVMAEAARRAGGGKPGKKGQQAEAAKAHAAAGRFAVPAGPRLAVDNT